MREITTKEQLEELLALSEQGPVLVYKHSATCPISADAYEKLRKAEGEGELPQIPMIVVQNSRELSGEIAEVTGIQHETPQVIVIHKREPIFAASHYQIKPAEVAEQLQ